MKKILLLGNIQAEDAAINDLINRNDLLVLKADTLKKAVKMLSHNSLDFILCTGKIQQTSEGNYFLEM